MTLTVETIKKTLKENHPEYTGDLIRNIGKCIFYDDNYDVNSNSSSGDNYYPHFSISSKWGEDKSEFTTIEDLVYKFEIVDHFGGEGQGDNFWGVAKVTDKKTNEYIHIMVAGWYASYHGSECDDYEHWQLVTPKIVEKTVWV